MGDKFKSPLTAPSMTTTQRDAMTPTNGDHIYNTTLSRHQVRTNGSWLNVVNPTDSMDATSWAGSALGASFTASLADTAMPTYDGANSQWKIDLLQNLVGITSTYTPTLTQSGTVTKTVNRGRYMQVGKWVFGSLSLTPTANGTTNNAVLVGIPVTARVSTSDIAGHGFITIAGTTYRCEAVIATSTSLGLRRDDITGTSNIGVDPNAALASSGDLILVSFMYEAA